MGDINIRILVTGGAGYIGSVLLTKLVKNYNVRVIDNLVYGYNGLIPHLGDANFEFIRGDIRDTELLKKSLENIDFVIHLAAIVGYPACKARPGLAHDINYFGTKNLVKHCNVPIIYASTGSNYGHVKEICYEKTPLNPLTEYGQSKAKAEEEIKKTDHVIYRFSTGFGLSPRMRLDLLVNDFLFRAVREKELIVYEKDYWRSFIHIKDMARSLIFAIENYDEMKNQVFNIGSKDCCMTKEDVALKIKEYVDYYLKFANFGHDPDQRNYRVSFQKINFLGFKTKYNIDDGIEEMLNLYEFLEPKECYYNNKVFR